MVRYDKIVAVTETPNTKKQKKVRDRAIKNCRNYRVKISVGVNNHENKFFVSRTIKCEDDYNTAVV